MRLPPPDSEQSVDALWLRRSMRRHGLSVQQVGALTGLNPWLIRAWLRRPGKGGYLSMKECYRKLLRAYLP